MGDQSGRPAHLKYFVRNCLNKGNQPGISLPETGILNRFGGDLWYGIPRLLKRPDEPEVGPVSATHPRDLATWLPSSERDASDRQWRLLCAAGWLALAVSATRVWPLANGLYYFRQWRRDETWLETHARLHAGRDPTPGAAIIDSQSVKTQAGGMPGFDGTKKLAGRKRLILVGTQSWLLSVVVYSADLQDRQGGRLALAAAREHFFT